MTDFTFMDMLGNGLRAYEVGTYGGWGGRQVSNQEMQNIFTPMSDTSQQAMATALSSMNSGVNKTANAYPNSFPAAQRDFAARLKWSVTPKYANANHAPVVQVEGPSTVMASPGETIKLNGAASDPDGNKVSLKWWQFGVGSYTGNVDIADANTKQAKLLIPKDAVAGQTIHVIIEATDTGSPALTSYQRVIVMIREK